MIFHNAAFHSVKETMHNEEKTKDRSEYEIITFKIFV